MTLKKAALRQPASQEQSGFEDQPNTKLHKTVVSESNLDDRKLVDPDVSSLIKVIEHVLLEKKQKPSKFKSFLSHPLVLVIVSGIIGVVLTYYYTNKQKDIEYVRSNQQLRQTSQRSFSDELNKIRIQKFGEVWENIDKNEVLIDNLLNKPNRGSNSDNQNIDTVNSLIQEDKLIINKNRFWLGDHYYYKLKEYSEKNIRLTLNMLLARPGTDLSKITKEREQAKLDILEVRKSMLLDGEPGK
jgi:hypothetical protein